MVGYGNAYVTEDSMYMLGFFFKKKENSKYEDIYRRNMSSLTSTAAKLCVSNLISVKVIWLSSY